MNEVNVDFGDGQFQIPEANWAKFEKAIEKLSKKCIKLTGEPITPIVFGYDMVEIKKGQLIKVYNVLLGGEAPKYNGWTFVGRIDHANKEVGNIVRALPGKKVPESYRTGGCTCDHCNVNRFRRDTFILQHNDGTYKQVGSTCLKDFLGHENPEHLAKRAELLSYAFESARGFINSVGDDRRYLQLEWFLTEVAAAIRQRGYFVSKATAEEKGMQSTASAAIDRVIHGYDNNFFSNEADAELAQNAIEWAQNLGADGKQLNDYEHNIHVLAQSGTIEFRSTGYAASIIAAYQRATNAPRIARKVSQHVGAVGDKLTSDVTLKRVSVTPDRGFGEGWFYLFEDTNGNILKWFTSKTLDLEEGDICKLSFKVKKHDDFNGTKQTEIFYCKIV